MNQQQTSPQTLYYRSEPLNEPIEHNYLRQLLQDVPDAIIAAEPEISLPSVNGKPQAGRHPAFQSIARELPPPEIALREVSLFGQWRWLHLVAPQAAGKLPGRILIWSLLDDLERATPRHGLVYQEGKTLAWQDRKRFALPATDHNALNTFTTGRYLEGGRLITWRIVPGGVSQ